MPRFAGCARSIETAERAQAIDQEDHVSHDRLWKCYAELSQAPRLDVPTPEANGDVLSASGG